MTDQPPSKQVEDLLCSILALVLNRKKPVEYVLHPKLWHMHGIMASVIWNLLRQEILTVFVGDRRGHHGRALEEAVLSQKSQWPRNWQGVNPLHGNRDFNSLSPKERVCRMFYNDHEGFR